jgi:hypothetical protein
VVALAVAGAGCDRRVLLPTTDAGSDLQATNDDAAPDGDAAASSRASGPPLLVDAGLPAGTDGPVLGAGADAESLVTSAACDLRSRPASEPAPQSSGGATGWARNFADGASISVSTDAQGRIALLSTQNGDVDFGSGTITAPAGQRCTFLSSFSADGAHRWSRGLTTGDRAKISSWADGGIAVAFARAVARFTSDGAVAWARRSDDATMAVVAQSDGSLFLVTRWTQVVPQPAATQTVMKLSGTGDVMSRFTFDDGDARSTVSISPTGDIFVVRNFDENAHLFSLSKLEADGQLLWSRNFTAPGFIECVSAAPTAQGGVVTTGWAPGDTDFGGGAVMAGAASISFAATFDRQGRHVASSAFASHGPYIMHSLATPAGGVVLATDLAGSRTIGGNTIHTGSEADRDVVVVELDAGLQVARISRFGNGGGNQVLNDLGLAPDGALLLAGSFEGKLDLGWGTMRTDHKTDAYLARITASSPAPAAATPSETEPPLPAGLTAPAPPEVSCDPAAAGAVCDLPPSDCPAGNASDGSDRHGLSTWLAYYENPRCVAGRCVWDQRYFRCRGDFVCIMGACSSATIGLTESTPTASF